MSLLAIDIGSSACKAVLFSTSGDLLFQHSSPYAPDHPRPFFAEMNPEQFWSAVCISSQAVTKYTLDPVQALCLSSHGETFIPIDSDGRPLAPAILNQDIRAANEARWLEERIGRKRLFQITGLVAHSMYTIPKIIWLRENRRDIFNSTACFVNLVGYVLRRMDLDSYVDYSLASRFLGFDIQRRSWSEEILEAANLRSDQLPIPVPAGTVAGRLDCEIARSLGVPPNTPVIVGGHDQPCAALGMGVIDEGRVSDSIGTYECTLASSDKPCLTDSALDASLNSFCHVVPEKFVTLAYFPSGLMVKWLHNLLYGPSANVNEEIPAEAAHYSVLEAGVREGPTGLCITPHLIGTGNPEFNANARGAIAGLTQDTTGSDLYKGVIEGLACELTMITQTLAKSVGDFRDMYVTGGGARSPLGLQLRAALTGCTLHVMKSPEAACLGTAILAGVAIGEFRDQNQAVRQTVHETAVIPPNPEIAACYVDQMDQYRTFRTAMTVRPRHSN